MHADLLLTGISQLVTTPHAGAVRGARMADLTVLEDAAVAIAGGRITWIGPQADRPDDAARRIDLGGRAVVPALVDPHTHAVWAGDRLADFEARIAGVPYEAILAGGGGIRRTMRHTAAASVAELVALARPRVDALIASGAGTIEIKSGYGFTPEAELASLEAIAALRRLVPATLLATLLIHVPPSDPGERDAYLAVVTERLIPEVAARRLADAVDIFIEREAFSAEEARRVFAAAAAHGLAAKAHADQFHAVGGVEAAIAAGARSVDHLEASTPAQVAALAAAPTIGTILPGVTLHLGLPAAPGRALIDAGAAVAVGTDLNPGSSPLFSTAEAAALAVRLNGLTLAEALVAATANAAVAAGRPEAGRLRPGAPADLLVLADADWRVLPYTLGGGVVHRRFLAGHEVPS